eukprot:5779655-Pyramimonas_sp.AAC.1
MHQSIPTAPNSTASRLSGRQIAKKRKGEHISLTTGAHETTGARCSSLEEPVRVGGAPSPAGRENAPFSS